MMYSEKLVVAVRANGKVLREHKDLVYVPFGTEYSLLIKNKNSVRALVRVEIDGQDATEGTSLIVPANGSIDLERFIKSGNLEQGNRFKFIERTKKIEDGPRGIGAEDGLIRVEFEFERQTIVNNWTNDSWTRTIGGGILRNGGLYDGGGVTGPYYGSIARGATIGQVTSDTVTYSANSLQASYSTGVASATLSTGDVNAVPANATETASFQAALNDVGITVPGSISDQRFVTGSWFPTDGVKHVMILKMLGEVEGKIVEKPVTVKAKPTCTTCGTVNKANAKFCRECGTALSIV